MRSLQHCLIVWGRLSLRLSARRGLAKDLAWKTNLCLRVYFPHDWNFIFYFLCFFFFLCGHYVYLNLTSKHTSDQCKQRAFLFLFLQHHLCLFGTVLHMWEVNRAQCAPHAGTVTLQCANMCTRWHYGTYDSVAVVDFHFGRQKRAPLTQVMITNCSFSPSWCSYYHKELHSHLFINSSSFFL